MSHIRSLIAVAGLVIALAPAAAQAGTNEDVIASNKAMVVAANQQANLANDLARCKLASTGTVVSGGIGFSQPAPTGGCTGMPAPAPAASTTAPGGKCVSAMRPLTKAELDQVNEFVINAADAIADGETPLTMPPDVVLLIGC
jgi:hypothetical protein